MPLLCVEQLQLEPPLVRVPQVPRDVERAPGFQRRADVPWKEEKRNQTPENVMLSQICRRETNCADHDGVIRRSEKVLRIEAFLSRLHNQRDETFSSAIFARLIHMTASRSGGGGLLQSLSPLLLHRAASFVLVRARTDDQRASKQAKWPCDPYSMPDTQFSTRKSLLSEISEVDHRCVRRKKEGEEVREAEIVFHHRDRTKLLQFPSLIITPSLSSDRRKVGRF